MTEHTYEKWLRDRNKAVRDAVKACYEECEKMLDNGDPSEEYLIGWRRRCIRALSPEPLRKYFWEFSASSFTKRNLRSALNLLDQALEHVNRPGFTLPNLKIDCGLAFEVPPPEVLLGME